MIGVWDPDVRVAEEVAAGWSARVGRDAAALLDDQPEAVWVCTEPAHQGDVVLQCAQRRIPFFALPPGCADFERARATARLLQTQSLVTAVGFPARHTDIVREAREFLGETPVPLLSASWLRTAEEGMPRESLRTIWTEACVLVDALRLFAGDVARVWAVSVGEAHSGVQVQMQFEGGAAATFTCATFARPEPKCQLELVAAGSALALSDEFGSLRLEEADRTSILRRMNNPASEMTTAFLRAVEERDPAVVQPDFADAFRTLAVCRAAAIAAEEQRIVALSELL
jgi:predicted dehydrogenase